MKTLYDRIKNEYKDALTKHVNKYPYIGMEILDELKSKSYIHNMSYGLWVDLRAICGNNNSNIKSPYDLFED